MPTTTTLPPTDALSLACAAIRQLDHQGIVPTSEQSFDVQWFGHPDRDIDPPEYGVSHLPSAWSVNARIEAFCIAIVR